MKKNEEIDFVWFHKGIGARGPSRIVHRFIDLVF